MVAGDYLLRRYVAKHLELLFAQDDMQEFIVFVDSRLVSFLYPAYNRSMMRINAFLRQGRNDKALKEIDILITQPRLSGLQLQEVELKAFELSISSGNDKKASYWLKRIKEFGNDGLMQDCKIVYEVTMKGSSAYINKMESELPSATGERKAQLSYLLEKQYQNLAQANNDEALNLC